MQINEKFSLKPSAFQNIFAMFLLFLTLSFAMNSVASNKINAEEAKKSTELSEKDLLANLQKKPNDFQSLVELGYHYFNLAHKHESMYLWGTPKKDKKNREKTNLYTSKTIEYLAKAVKLNAKDATAFTRIANAYGMKMRVGGFGAKMKYLSDFRDNLKKAFEIDSKNKDARITEAFRVLYTPSLVSNRTKKAQAQFKDLQKEYPNDHEIIKGLAVVNQREDNIEKAFELIERVLSIKADDLEAISLRAEIKKKLDKERKKKKK